MGTCQAKHEEEKQELVEFEGSIREILRKEPGFQSSKETIKKSAQKIADKPEKEQAQPYQRFVKAQGLVDALRSDDTAFISGAWLRRQPLGYVLAKRGKLPPNAYVKGSDLIKIYQERNGYAANQFPLIAVSHLWRTDKHPDPKGVTVRAMQDELEKLWPWLTKESCGFEDVGIYYDWCSVWQGKLSPEQQSARDRALKNVSLWFAHRLTSVWLVTDAKIDHQGKQVGYTDFGWRMFESKLASMIKEASPLQLLEIGGGHKLLHNPPLDPMAFYEHHRFGNLVYKNPADRDIVAPLFRETVRDIYAGVPDLSYRDQPWDKIHTARLGLVLPLCVSLQRLSLFTLGLTPAGLKALLEPCVVHSALPKLREFDLFGNDSLGDDGARLLVAALEQNALPKLIKLDVAQCNISKIPRHSLAVVRDHLKVQFDIRL